MKTIAQKMILRTAAITALLLSLIAPAYAADSATSVSNPEEFITASEVSNDELATNRGAGVNVSIMSANLGNNSATNTVSGDNVIGAGALTGFAGFANLIQNSGNNVIIQQSTIVNVTLQ
jgi:hypothetical protein